MGVNQFWYLGIFIDGLLCGYMVILGLHAVPLDAPK